MVVESAASWKPNFAHFVLGAITLLVLLFDVVVHVVYTFSIWLFISRGPEWTVGLATGLTLFLLLSLLFGLGTGIGIVSRSFGFPSRLATEWRPLFSILARIILFMTPMLYLVVQWDVWQSGAYIMLYLVPSTAALFFLSVINLAWRRDEI